MQWGAAADRDVVGEVPRPAGIPWSTVLGGDGHRILQHLDGGQGVISKDIIPLPY